MVQLVNVCMIDEGDFGFVSSLLEVDLSRAGPRRLQPTPNSCDVNCAKSHSPTDIHFGWINQSVLSALLSNLSYVDLTMLM